ncbi:hypothetical protein GDO78_001242 [Eleutherodactylus coqui]|uniref:Uncharacterized protein n=1 Tax=Eleutherodactylus coqui TaxID=57060 RepID=A0A8J6KHI0_ELECQ|nr:hypothetical protein GDO78_001242 [Eleutherodactylus coqui]
MLFLGVCQLRVRYSPLYWGFLYLCYWCNLTIWRDISYLFMQGSYPPFAFFALSEMYHFHLMILCSWACPIRLDFGLDNTQLMMGICGLRRTMCPVVNCSVSTRAQ